ncbi:hypothetical protein M758_11G045500 [Ceratodon purpureus]|uniref:Uncharacterized protein n=1 Tax=Ceratodon purpureus TaxID=3225 RepID=A0A8T0GCX2_CERPU|nr:hypothetical protein KC19_11G047200 [Ceratodon purpureus]KAG0600588.1 hypothetical protein M758_11G045500 [Ceratodon purpureus]
MVIKESSPADRLVSSQKYELELRRRVKIAATERLWTITGNKLELNHLNTYHLRAQPAVKKLGTQKTEREDGINSGPCLTCLCAHTSMEFI